MQSAEILTIIAIITSWICGVIAKKISWFKNFMIPVQNIIIGVVFTFIEFLISKDINIAIATSGLLAGGTYDFVSNLNKIFELIKQKFNK